MLPKQCKNFIFDIHLNAFKWMTKNGGQWTEVGKSFWLRVIISEKDFTLSISRKKEKFYHSTWQNRSWEWSWGRNKEMESAVSYWKIA